MKILRHQDHRHGVPLVDKMLGNGDRVGKLATITAPLANYGNENPRNRQLIESVVGTHKGKKLPPFAAQTFAAQFANNRQTPTGEPVARFAFFSTCCVNYNQPEIGTDAAKTGRRGDHGPDGISRQSSGGWRTQQGV